MTTTKGKFKKLQQEINAFRSEINRLIPKNVRKDVKELIDWIVENEIKKVEVLKRIQDEEKY